MNTFGYVTVEKTKYEPRTKVVRVKSWRAKLAEKLLKRDVEQLESDLRYEQDKAFQAKVAEEANEIISRVTEEYKMQLDEEILEALDMYELQFDHMFHPIDKSKEVVFDIVQTRTITSWNGIRVTVPLRFIKKKAKS